MTKPCSINSKSNTFLSHSIDCKHCTVKTISMSYEEVSQRVLNQIAIDPFTIFVAYKHAVMPCFRNPKACRVQLHWSLHQKLQLQQALPQAPRRILLHRSLLFNLQLNVVYSTKILSLYHTTSRCHHTTTGISSRVLRVVQTSRTLGSLFTLPFKPIHK